MKDKCSLDIHGLATFVEKPRIWKFMLLKSPISKQLSEIRSLWLGQEVHDALASKGQQEIMRHLWG